MRRQCSGRYMAAKDTRKEIGGRRREHSQALSSLSTFFF